MRNVLLVAVALGVSPAGAVAQSSELRLFSEPSSYTNVIDAFDGQDPFDLNLSLGFSRSRFSGTIQRERSLGGSSHALVDVAEHERITNTLLIGAQVGLFQDLALFVDLPVVLTDDRRLNTPSGRTPSAINDDLCEPEPGVTDGACDGGRGEPLFEVPFEAPTRSGVPYLGVGLAWAVFNQFREPTLPTWVLRLEGRVNIGSALRACSEFGGCRGGADAGISEGTNALRIETRVSRRIDNIEPYAGFLFHVEWPGKAADFFKSGGDLAGFNNTLPPRVGEATVGATFIPWEERARWQRFSIDLRLKAAFVSEGHGYSPLFDALGTSQSSFLTEDNLEAIPDGSFSPRATQFSGLTDMQAHGRFGGTLSLEMWASQYLRFILGTTVSYSTPYLITFADACNADASVSADDPRRGTCTSGIINPHHRPAIDLPGSRFRLDGEVGLDLFVSGVAQF